MNRSLTLRALSLFATGVALYACSATTDAEPTESSVAASTRTLTYSWSELPGGGRATAIAVALNPADYARPRLWVLGSDNNADHGVYYYDWASYSWRAIDGAGVEIAVDSAENIYVVNSNHEGFRRAGKGGAWENMSNGPGAPKFSSISVSPNGSQLWATGWSSGCTNGNYDVKFWNAAAKQWSNVQMPNVHPGVRVAAGNDGPVVINAAHEAWKYTSPANGDWVHTNTFTQWGTALDYSISDTGMSSVGVAPVPGEGYQTNGFGFDSGTNQWKWATLPGGAIRVASMDKLYGFKVTQDGRIWVGNGNWADYGTNGQPCAPNNSCDAPLVCSNGYCTTTGEQNHPCRADGSCNGGLSCQSGTCKTCGAQNTACCGAACNSGLTCQSGVCKTPAPTCGFANAPCCGSACNSGLTCQGGTCKTPAPACTAQIKAYNAACYDAAGTMSSIPVGSYTITTCETTAVDLATAEIHARAKWVDTYHVADCIAGVLPCCTVQFAKL